MPIQRPTPLERFIAQVYLTIEEKDNRAVNCLSCGAECRAGDVHDCRECDAYYCVGCEGTDSHMRACERRHTELTV